MGSQSCLFNVYSQNQSHHRTHCYCAPPAADAQILHSAKRRTQDMPINQGTGITFLRFLPELRTLAALRL